MKRYFKCEIKPPAGGSTSLLTMSHYEWTESFNDWFIQERITSSETQNSVWNNFSGEIEQKQVFKNKY